MSENQLNFIETSQQPQNDQLLSRNGINFTMSSQEQKHPQIQKEKSQMNISQIEHQQNYEPLEQYHQEMNDNFEGKKRILQQEQENQMTIGDYYQNQYPKETESPQLSQQYMNNRPFQGNQGIYGGSNGIIEEIQVKILDEGYNYEPQQQIFANHTNENDQTNPLNRQNHIIQENSHTMNKVLNQNYLYENGHMNSQHFKQNPQPSNNTQSIEQNQKNYNSYVQAVLNNPLNPAADPSHEALQQIYNQLKKRFPQCMPQQIILLLYNNLIKIPRQEMIEQEGDQFDQTLKYNVGKKYFQDIVATKDNAQLFNYQLRKQMVKIYITKGYGLKVYQQQMLAINPNTPPINKDKFKSHFVAIYKTVIKKVEEFISNAADRQFQPLTRKEFNMTLGDVINCRKHYQSQFCEIFFRLIQSTFDSEFAYQKLPNQQEVIFFYRTIMTKLRSQKILLAKKMHQPEEEVDTDIWSDQFQYHFIKLYILQRNIAGVKIKLIQQYPQCQGHLTDQKLKQKIENALRTALKLLQIQNQNCGNQIAFSPTDIDKRFIMKAPELEQTRIKLLKVYVKKPKDPQVLSGLVNFINQELKNKYEQEKIPLEVLQKSTANQIQRNSEKAQFQKIIKAQIIKNP